MNRYIVDTSIVVQLVIEDTHTAQTKVLFKGIDDGDRLTIPEFCLMECTNVLWKQVRFNDVPLETAASHVKDLQALDLEVVFVTHLLPRALEIGIKHQLAIYDSIYIALAEQLSSPLITDDAKLPRQKTLPSNPSQILHNTPAPITSCFGKNQTWSTLFS